MWNKVSVPKAGISSTVQKLNKDIKTCYVLYSCYQIAWVEEIAQPAGFFPVRRYKGYDM